jgi:hypothetical protein
VALTAVFVRDDDEEIAGAMPVGGDRFRMMLELIGAVAPDGEATAKVDFPAERVIVEHLREGDRFLLIAGSRPLADVAITTVLWKRRPPHRFAPEEFERACLEEIRHAFETSGFARRDESELGLRYEGARLEGRFPDTRLVLELEDLRRKRIELRAYDLYSSIWDAPFIGGREGPGLGGGVHRASGRGAAPPRQTRCSGRSRICRSWVTRRSPRPDQSVG